MSYEHETVEVPGGGKRTIESGTVTCDRRIAGGERVGATACADETVTTVETPS